jgi:PPK2 family polyphosphate:nucleotide phosphotransferase
MREALSISPKAKFRLADRNPAGTCGYSSKTKAEAELGALKETMSDLQQLLYADSRYALLLVFQAMDAGGKDGVIRQVMSGLNPQGCQVTSFKAPSTEELAHDFLWRIDRALPRYGQIGIFNRSHYEDVLIARVRALVPEKVWKARYEEINRFEEHLYRNRIVTIKFCLHVSKKEQERRFLERLLDPKKNWKFSPLDLKERERWDDYMTAYEEALSRCSTRWAPWYVIPANKKWFRNLAVARIIVDTLKELPLQWPKPSPETAELARRAKESGRLPGV